MKKMNEMISTSESSNKNFFLLLVLCFLLGVFGVHRFYCGKIKSGIFMLLTIGGLGVWAVANFVIACFGEFTDAEGKKIKYNNY
jgi:TM2 domain-containing membrane protein YozV